MSLAGIPEHPHEPTLPVTVINFQEARSHSRSIVSGRRS